MKNIHRAVRANLDLDILRSFATLAETGSFTRTGERLLRSQSAISVQIKRLEERLGKRLLVRAGRSVSLTEDGEQLLAYARRILALNDDAVAHLTAPAVSGAVRLGAAEEFAAHKLAGPLGRFARSHPDLKLEITVDTSARLLELLDRGKLDLALAKRVPGEGPGEAVWREPLLWVAGTGYRDDPARPVPIAASPPPCLYRRFMLEALERERRPWRIVCTSGANAALQAAVMAGLGVSALARSTVLPGMRVLMPEEGFPRLPDSEIALYVRAGEPSPALDWLCRFLRTRLDAAPAPAEPASPQAATARRSTSASRREKAAGSGRGSPSTIRA